MALVPAALFLIATLAFAQAPKPPTPDELMAKAGQAFEKGEPVDKAVKPEEFKAAFGESKDSPQAKLLALAYRLQVTKPGKPPTPARVEEVKEAAKLLKADEKACLCRYATGECPNPLAVVSNQPTGPGNAGFGEQGGGEGGATGSWLSGGVGGAAGGTLATAGGFGNANSNANANAPRTQYRADFSRNSLPPPAPLTGKDKVINTALSVANMEAYSRSGTVNRESVEGTQREICRLLKKANYSPSEAWGYSLVERNAKGADPGNLDLRNAEHYLYAYQTTYNPQTIGDSVPVQFVMAVGWTPFKTVTKHFRPTSTPSMQEMGWGVDGSLDGARKPDWRARCGDGRAPTEAGKSA